MTPEKMYADAKEALAAGTGMTLVLRKGRRLPAGFPRGELLCENHDGDRAYRHDPAKIIRWLTKVGLASL